MNKFRILVVDDEPRIIKFLKLRLEASGYEVFTASSGLEALDLVMSEEPNLIVLDLVMPGMDGLETIKQLRKISSVPVIILSARESSQDKVRGLDSGADDYLAKPFNPSELIARIESVKRRLSPDQERVPVDYINLGRISLDLNKHIVVIDRNEVKLTRIEWLLLDELAKNAGKIMFSGELLARIWGPEYRNDIQILRTWISRLRKKIEKDPNNPDIIRTVPRTGYYIDFETS